MPGIEKVFGTMLFESIRKGFSLVLISFVRKLDDGACEIAH